MSRRRAKWGCENRRVPWVEIYEVRLETSEGSEHPPRPKEVLCCVIMNALRDQYAEPHEHLQLTHIVPLDVSDASIIGWRVFFKLSTPKEWWFFRRPAKDCWEWEDDDFVPRSSVTEAASLDEAS
jgi:hypothetical protein